MSTLGPDNDPQFELVEEPVSAPQADDDKEDDEDRRDARSRKEE